MHYAPKFVDFANTSLDQVVAIMKRNKPTYGRDQYIHVSCEAKMIDVPIDPLKPDATKRVPWVDKGTTYNIGRNVDKRARKSLARGAARV